MDQPAPQAQVLIRPSGRLPGLLPCSSAQPSRARVLLFCRAGTFLPRVLALRVLALRRIRHHAKSGQSELPPEHCDGAPSGRFVPGFSSQTRTSLVAA